MGELALSDTIGTLVQPGVTPERTSGGLGWEHLYLSRQRELPSPHQFVLARRVEEACRLLAHSAVPIGEVARRCGFSHQEHLTRVIRARTRTTPATIRREASAARFVQSEEQ